MGFLSFDNEEFLIHFTGILYYSAHPKIKLYISHGGISGVYEAVDAGVPVLGLPLFYDQPKNIEHLVHIGMAISMDLQTLTADTFLKNVVELVNNEK